VNEKTYLVEVLLRAREQISQVAQRAAKALDSVTAAQERMGDSSRGQVPKLRDQITALEQLTTAHIREKKALEDSSAVFRFRANARKADADAARRSLEELQRQARIERALADEKKKRDIEEISRIRLEIAEREAADVAQDRAYKNETSRLRKEANLLKALADENAAANQRRAAETAVQIANTQQQTRETVRSAQVAERTARVEEAAHERVSRSVATNTRQLDVLRERFNKADADTTRFGRTLDRLGLSGGNASKGLRGLNAEFQGLAIALAVKYAQSLITVLGGLAAQFVAVAAAAGQAAAGIAGALGAGAAQAVPVVGVLAASFARLAAVLKVVKLQNQEQLRASQDAVVPGAHRRRA
jgi:hypothetical protein